MMSWQRRQVRLSSGNQVTPAGSGTAKLFLEEILTRQQKDSNFFAACQCSRGLSLP